MSLDKRLLAQVSYLYYENNMTQQQIADQTGLNRMKISRLLQKAKDQGVVRVIIDYTGTHLQMEQELARKFGLREVIVVDSVQTNAKKRVAAAAAFYLENNLKSNQVVAVGWGSTICGVAEFVKEVPEKKLLFTPAIGGHGKSALDFHATSIAASLAKKTGCRALSLLAPAFVSNKAEREALLREPHIRETLAAAAGADLALFSLGNPLVPDSSLSKSGYFSEADLVQLRKENTVCDLISILFLDKDGKACGGEVTERSVGLSQEQLKNIPRKVCAVSGSEKSDSTLVALRAGFIDVLIVDLDIAKYLANAS